MKECYKITFRMFDEEHYVYCSPVTILESLMCVKSLREDVYIVSRIKLEVDEKEYENKHISKTLELFNQN